MADADTTQQHTMQEAIDHANAVWQPDFNEEELLIPYKRAEEGADDGKETGDDKPDPDEKAEETDTETTDYTDPAPVVTATDPGEYKAADYSFDVTLKDGKVVKVTTVDDAEKLSDDPDNFETARQLLDFIRKTTQLQNKLDKDHDTWQAKKDAYDTQLKTQEERNKTVQNLTAGFEYLIAKGLMPPLDPADAIADWRNPEVAKHEGVKQQMALINYMTKENEQREKAGIPVLGSALDAYNAWKLDEDTKAANQEAKQAGQARRAAGARVAGVSASQQGSIAPKGIAVGRVMPKRSAAIWDN